jgi:hypothetical protein
MSKALYTIEASFKRNGQTIDCSEPEILGSASGAQYRSRRRAIEIAEEAQEAIDDAIKDGDVDPTTVVSVYKGRIQVWTSR